MNQTTERQSYPTDLTDKQWETIEPLFTKMRTYKWSKRELTNAVLYLVDSGCKWRQLPHDFPLYSTVHSFYRRARLSGLRDGIMKRLVIITRKNAGRNKNPTYAIIDSQSVKKVASGEERGFDGEKMKERKRRIVIVSGGQDSLGLSFTPRTFMTRLPESMRRQRPFKAGQPL